VDCCRRFVESFVKIPWIFEAILTAKKKSFLVDLSGCVAIAVLAEDILLLALLSSTILLSSLLYLWFGPLSVLMSFLRLFSIINRN